MMIKYSRIFYQTYYLKHLYSTSQHSTKKSSISIIDLTESYDNQTYCKELAKQIDEICQNIGFFLSNNMY